MVAGPLRGDASFSAGALAGTLAYLSGVVLLAFVGRLGLHPASGIWGRGFAGAEYVALHVGVHLPVWQGRVHAEVLIYTVLSITVLALAGVLVARTTAFECDGTIRDGGSGHPGTARNGGPEGDDPIRAGDPDSTGTIWNGDPPGNERAFRAGSAIVAGYLPVMALASLYSVLAVDAITVTGMIAPVGIVGGFYPVVFGGIGGLIATRLPPR